MIELEKYAKPLLRYSMGLVFLYFGFQQITNPFEWTGFIPDFALSFGLSATILVIGNALFELILGTLLLLGMYTKFVSLILSIHVFIIALSIGFNPLGIRDFGLSLATLAIFFNGPDEYCLDKKLSK